MSQEEDFACNKFAPQKWRKDICRNCYQPARLHEKKLARQGTLTTSPSTKSPPQTLPVVKASTLPPRIKPPTAPKSSLLLKTPPDPKPPVTTTKAGSVASRVPAKPAPPPMAKAATIARPPPPPKAEPKVFQRFKVKKEPLIDRSVPPKERTKQQELEGIQPGIVKDVHDIAPTLKTNIPPKVQAILDQNAKSASAKATDSGTTESVTQPPQESSPNEAAAMETGPSPPPPAVPPRPAGYELTDETSPTKTTPDEQKEPQTTASTTPSQPQSGQEERQKIENSASPVSEQPSSPSRADSEAIAEIEATTQPRPPVSKEEEDIIPVAASNQEDEAKDEKNVDDFEKKEIGEEQVQVPEPVSEAKAEPQPVINTPAAAPVCTDKILCLLPKRQGSTDEGKGEKMDEEVQIPPEPDSEVTVPGTEGNVISKDDKTETVGEEKNQSDNNVQLPESAEEKEEGAKEEPVASGDQETLTQTADVKIDGVQGQEVDQVEINQAGSEEKPVTPEIQEENEKQEAGDQNEPKENVESAVPASEAESSETLQTKEEPAEQTQVNVGGEKTIVDEIITATPVAMLESELEGTDGGAATAASDTEQTSSTEADQQTVAEAQEETPASNGDIKDSTQSTEGEEKQQLDEASVGVEQECGNGIVSDENQPTTTTESTSEALVVEEENSQSNAAAIDVTREAEIPEEEEVKSKIPPPPPPPAQEEIKRDDEGEDESVPPPPPLPLDGLPLAPPPPPPPADGLPLPPPPPPPPPIGVQIPKGPPKAEEVKKKAQSVKPPRGAMAHEEAMAAIKGGVRLKSVPAPAERQAGEEKVVDVASELRQKLMKQKRKEIEGISSQVELHREEANKLAEILHNCAGTHSFIHQLKSLLAQVDSFLAKCNIPDDVLAKKLQWPTHLVTDLREVIEHMRTLEQKVAAAETLCKQTLLKSTQPVPAPPPRPGQNGGQTSSTGGSSGGLARSASLSSTRGVNPAAVERCVQDVVRLARDLNTDESRYFRAAQSYPVDVSDIQSMLQRAADTVAPLIDQMYEKATQAHKSIFEVSVTKFDQGFRVQNARRLLKMCCDMSDVLAMHLQLPKHAQYSDAQLKYQELAEDFHNAIKVMERRGDWDSEEQVQLGTQSKTGKKLELRSKEDSQLVQRIIEALSGDGGEGGSLPEELEAQLTPEVLARIEVQLIKAVMANGQLKVVDGVCALKGRVYSGNDDTAVLLHRYDFEWLLEAVVKGNHNLISHLVQSCGMFVNAISSGGFSVLYRAAQRQDIRTVTHLIRLGADPLLRNTFNSSSAQMLALKCFPPSHFSDKLEEKEHLFDLTAYINNPSLSDVVLVSEDGQRFHAHRIVLCAQSLVLKTMLDSEVWADSKNKEVPLPTVSGRVMQLLLKYLYTGQCLFPRDDLNLGIELMAAADQFLLEPMKIQCERVLSEKIDAEVVVPLYYAAFRFNTPKLLACCQHFLLANYDQVEDPGYEALLHLLENSKAACS